jgi:hypothetical protein
MSLADRTLFQMDKAAPANQIFLWNHRKRRQAQIWIAVSVYVLVAIIQKRLHLDLSLYTILQILSVTIFKRISLLLVGTGLDDRTDHLKIYNQLNLYD